MRFARRHGREVKLLSHTDGRSEIELVSHEPGKWTVDSIDGQKENHDEGRS